jgi:hypothetical protein
VPIPASLRHDRAKWSTLPLPNGITITITITHTTIINNVQRHIPYNRSQAIYHLSICTSGGVAVFLGGIVERCSIFRCVALRLEPSAATQSGWNMESWLCSYWTLTNYDVLWPIGAALLSFFPRAASCHCIWGPCSSLLFPILGTTITYLREGSVDNVLVIDTDHV